MPATKLRLVAQNETLVIRSSPAESIGRIMLKHGWITQSDLIKAFSLQQYGGAPIGEVLVGMGCITPDQLQDSLAEQFGIARAGLSEIAVVESIAVGLSPKICLEYQLLPLVNSDDTLLLAITDPRKIQTVQALPEFATQPLRFVLITEQDFQTLATRHLNDHLKHQALYACKDHNSCSFLEHSSLISMEFLVGIVALLMVGFLYPVAALAGALGVAIITSWAVIIFRFICLWTSGQPSEQTPPTPTQFPVKKATFSILIPLYKESDIFERLITRLQRLSYPKELVEFLIIVEHSDSQTQQAAQNAQLPINMRVIKVPDDRIKTKPRAMNFALNFCKGDIIGIYDAEDAPETDQLNIINAAFANAAPNTACIQAVLDFYNAKTNWISRCFTIEYAILFRFIVPMLDRLDLPIPLGGTTVFFRKDILEKLGRWDAFNVTEDADLGFRLYRNGYRCGWASTTTYEEANFRLVPWIKQRSRWLKGFLFTALVHLRNVKSTDQSSGFLPSLVFFILCISPWILIPLVPIILPMWLISFGLDLPLYNQLPAGLIALSTSSFILAEIATMILGYKATQKPHLRHLRKWLITMPLYWPLGFLAAVKAMYEFFIRPIYWDKSEHGINDTSYDKDIESLTDVAP